MIHSFSTYVHIILQISSYTELDKKPHLKELCDIVTPDYAAQWLEIGRHLDIANGELKIIKEDNINKGVKRCCDVMLEKWLEIESEVSWRKIVDSIKIVCNRLKSKKEKNQKVNDTKGAYVNLIYYTYVCECLYVYHIAGKFGSDNLWQKWKDKDLGKKRFGE